MRFVKLKPLEKFHFIKRIPLSSMDGWQGRLLLVGNESNRSVSRALGFRSCVFAGNMRPLEFSQSFNVFIVFSICSLSQWRARRSAGDHQEIPTRSDLFWPKVHFLETSHRQRILWRCFPGHHSVSVQLVLHQFGSENAQKSCSPSTKSNHFLRVICTII